MHPRSIDTFCPLFISSFVVRFITSAPVVYRCSRAFQDKDYHCRHLPDYVHLAGLSTISTLTNNLFICTEFCTTVKHFSPGVTKMSCTSYTSPVRRFASQLVRPLNAYPVPGCKLILE